MKTISIYNKKIKENLIEKLNNKKNEFISYKDDYGYYKDWNTFIDNYIIVYNKYIEDIKHGKLKNIEKDSPLLIMSKEDIIIKYTLLDITKLFLQYKYEYENLGLYCNVYRNTYNIVYPVMSSTYIEENNIFRNYFFLWDKNDKVYKKYTLDSIYNIVESFLQKYVYKSKKQREIYENTKFSVNIKIDILNKIGDKISKTLYTGYIENCNLDIFDELKNDTKITLLEFKFFKNNYVSSKFIFKGTNLKKSNIMSYLKLNYGTLNDIKYIKEILNLKGEYV